MKQLILSLAVAASMTACGGDAAVQPEAVKTATSGSQQVEVRLDRVIDPAADTADLEEGNRYVAVEFTVTNISDEPLTETRPDSDSWIVTSATSENLTASLHEVSDCQAFPKDVTAVAPGDALSGCVSFEIPAEATLQTFGYYFGESVLFDLSPEAVLLNPS